MRLAFLALLLVTIAPRAHAQSESELRALQRALPAGAAIEKELVLFSPQERERIQAASKPLDAPRVLRVFSASDEHGLAGFAVLGDAPGKSQPITYLVVTDAAAKLLAVEIVTYRESHGGEIRDARWRAQFVGKTTEAKLRHGDDIRNIAGATISCRSITDAVRRDLHALAIARPELERRATANRKPKERPARATSAPIAGRVTRSRLLMGTTLTIETDGGPDTALDAAFERVAELERLLSDWDATSEASRLSNTAHGTWMELSEPLALVLARAQYWQRESAGAFDPCLGALTRLARSGADASELARAARGPASLELDGRRARITREGARIDLGAIGKGFALDRAAEELERGGARRALLDFGGQLLALDAPEGEEGWAVAIRDPRDPEKILEIRSLRRRSIAVTADYERGRVVDDRRISHVLDPRTGAAVEGMLGAIVLDASATDADALSTTLFVLGVDAGERFARARGLETWLFAANGGECRTAADGRLSEHDLR